MFPKLRDVSAGTHMIGPKSKSQPTTIEDHREFRWYTSVTSAQNKTTDQFKHTFQVEIVNEGLIGIFRDAFQITKHNVLFINDKPKGRSKYKEQITAIEQPRGILYNLLVARFYKERTEQPPAIRVRTDSQYWGNIDVPSNVPTR